MEKTSRTDSFVAAVGEPKTGSGDIRELTLAQASFAYAPGARELDL